MTGGEFLVNTNTAFQQVGSSNTGLANGGYVVLWDDYSATLGDTTIAIKGQIYDKFGVPVGSEFLVNTNTAGNQVWNNVTALSDGGFLAFWEDRGGQSGDTDGSSIRGQRFDASGQALGEEFLVNTIVTGNQKRPAAAVLADGSFVVSWLDRGGEGGDADGSGVKAQRYNADGSAAGEEFLVNTNTTGNQAWESIAALTDGGFVVVWEDSGTGQDESGDPRVRAQRYDAQNVAQGGEIEFNTGADSGQWLPSVASLTGGGFVVSWMDNAGAQGDTSDFGIAGQRVGADGTALGDVFLVNSNTEDGQWYPVVTGLSDGGFALAWNDFSGTLGDASQSSIKAQVYSSDGSPQGGEFRVNTTTDDGQEIPAITGLSDGGFVVSWDDWSRSGGDTDQAAIRAQRYDANGDPVNHCAEIVDDDSNLWNSSLVTCDGELVTTAQSQLYRTAIAGLGDEPASDDFNSWLADIADGQESLDSLAAGIIASDEFRAMFEVGAGEPIADDVFLNYVYEDAFGRVADATGFGWWLNQLDSGGRSQSQALVEMTQSNEYVELTVLGAVDYVVDMLFA